MSKTKTTVVTALVAGMLAAILIGLYSLAPQAFYILTGLLALIGYGCAAVVFFRWLGGEKRESRREALLPPAMAKTARDGETAGDGRATARVAPTGAAIGAAEDGRATARVAPTGAAVGAAEDGAEGAAFIDEAWTGDYDAIRAELRGEEA